LASYTNIENLDGSLATENLVLSGNGAANTLIGGSGYDALLGGGGDDLLIGGANDDTLNGGSGIDTYMFRSGDAKDEITSAENKETVLFDSLSGIAKNDLLFYTDKSGTLYMDYTNNAIGADIVHITAGNYDGGTMIQVGDTEISINSITQYFAGSGSAYAGLDQTAINGLKVDQKETQSIALAWTQT